MPIVFPHPQDRLATLAAQARRLADALDLLAAGGQPSDADLADAPALDDWCIKLRESPVIHGKVTGHPERDDGDYASTDEVFAVDYDGRFALAFSGWYVLKVKAAPLRRRPL